MPEWPASGVTAGIMGGLSVGACLPLSYDTPATMNSGNRSSHKEEHLARLRLMQLRQIRRRMLRRADIEVGVGVDRRLCLISDEPKAFGGRRLISDEPKAFGGCISADSPPSPVSYWFTPVTDAHPCGGCLASRCCLRRFFYTDSCNLIFSDSLKQLV
jgi:hypothetical protein